MRVLLDDGRTIEARMAARLVELCSLNPADFAGEPDDRDVYRLDNGDVTASDYEPTDAMRWLGTLRELRTSSGWRKTKG